MDLKTGMRWAESDFTLSALGRHRSILRKGAKLLDLLLKDINLTAVWTRKKGVSMEKRGQLQYYCTSPCKRQQPRITGEEG